MSKSFEEILQDSYEIWKKNIIIGLPGLLTLFSIVFALIFLAIVIAILILFLGIEIETLKMNLQLGVALILLSILFFLFITTVNAFMISLAINMSIEAIENGRTGFNLIFYKGAKNFFPIFIASIIIFFLYVIPIFFFVGLGFILVKVFSFNLIPLIGAAIIGIGIYTLYIFCLGLLLAPVNYAIVIENLDGISGIKRGVEFFMRNKLVCILLISLLSGINTLLSIIGNSVASIFSVIPLIGPILTTLTYVGFLIVAIFIMSGISTVMWTKTYIERRLDKNYLEKLKKSVVRSS